MKIKIALADSRILPEEERRLMLDGFKVITLPPFSRLSPAVASHPDMLMVRLKDEYISFADYSEEASYIFSDISSVLLPCGARFSLTDDNISDSYPNDAKLNVLIMGDTVFANTKNISNSLKEKAEAYGYKIIHTNQGYPACTVLKLNDESAVTADAGMAKILEKHGIRVTLISQGGVSLPPYDYGFIGGSAEAYGGKLYTFGDICTHPDCEKIRSAALEAGLTVVPLSCGVLRDLGGILFAEYEID